MTIFQNHGKDKTTAPSKTEGAPSILIFDEVICSPLSAKAYFVAIFY